MALSLYSLVSSPPDKDRVFGNDVFVWINSLALWALPLYSLTGTPSNATGSCVSYIEKRGKIAPPSAHRKWIECYFKLLLCVAKPYIGEVARRDGGVKQYNRTIFLTPLLRNYRSFGLSPIFCTAKHRGERAIPTAVTKLSTPLSPCRVP